MLARQISSAQNSKVKLVKRLRGKRGREAEKRFVIDYSRDLQRALRQGYQIDFILRCPSLSDYSAAGDTDLYDISPQLLKRLSYRENPDGIIALLHSKSAKGRPEFEATAARQVLALVDLRVPGNIGALLRSAEATAVDAVILVDCALDLYNANIIRSSTGACFADTIFQLSGAEALACLKGGGFQIVAAAVDGAQTVFEVDFQRRSAILLGAEDKGLGRAWLENADLRARIPMAGQLSDSLNVSVSGAIFLYERYRQGLRT